MIAVLATVIGWFALDRESAIENAVGAIIVGLGAGVLYQILKWVWRFVWVVPKEIHDELIVQIVQRETERDASLAETSSVKKLLADLTEPQLTGLIRQLLTTADPIATGGRVPLFVIASIRNTGAPTIVDSWNLRVRLADGRQLSGERAINLESQRIPTDSGTLTYGPEDALYAKTTSPVGRFDEKTGMLTFLFRGVSVEDLVARGVVFRLTYRDARGVEFGTEYVSPGRLTTPAFFPGTNPRFEPNR